MLLEVDVAQMFPNAPLELQFPERACLPSPSLPWYALALTGAQRNNGQVVESDDEAPPQAVARLSRGDRLA